MLSSTYEVQGLRLAVLLTLTCCASGKDCRDLWSGEGAVVELDLIQQAIQSLRRTTTQKHERWSGDRSANRMRRQFYAVQVEPHDTAIESSGDVLKNSNL